MAAEPERVVQEGVDLHRAGRVRHVVQITGRIRVLQIDGRRSDLGLEGLAAQERFDTTRRTEHVSGRSLGGTNGQLPGIVSEDPLDGLGLTNITHRGARGVGIDVIDLFRAHLSVLEPHLDGPCRTGSLGIGRGHVVGVAGVAVAHDLAINAGPTLLGMLQLLEHQHRRALTHHETVAVPIERATGMLRVVIAGGHGLHGRKAAHAQRHDGGFGTASEHDRSVSALDRPPGLTNRVVAGRAGRARGKVRATEVVVEREQA